MSIRTRRVVAALAGFALLLVAGTVVTSAAKQRRVAQPGDFRLTLALERSAYRLGTTPHVKATIQNQSGEEVLLVPALDGSDMGRYPRVQFVVTRPEDAPEPEYLGRCGNTNNITVQDFDRVPDGASFNPLGEWGGLNAQQFNAPGVYTIQLIYDTQAEPDAWHGFMGRLHNKRAIAWLLGRVPSMWLESNSVEVTVAEVGSPALRTSPIPEI